MGLKLSNNNNGLCHKKRDNLPCGAMRCFLCPGGVVRWFPTFCGKLSCKACHGKRDAAYLSNIVCTMGEFAWVTIMPLEEKLSRRFGPEWWCIKIKKKQVMILSKRKTTKSNLRYFKKFLQEHVAPLLKAWKSCKYRQVTCSLKYMAMVSALKKNKIRTYAECSEWLMYQYSKLLTDFERATWLQEHETEIHLTKLGRKFIETHLVRTIPINENFIIDDTAQVEDLKKRFADNGGELNIKSESVFANCHCVAGM